mmetsp:Transcript_4213/g.13100  ORF Transcript_4213/g.13100 Transcript_4213/m.13100 type:complete len:288 (+) Transcript_4213:133-996(+)
MVRRRAPILLLSSSLFEEAGRTEERSDLGEEEGLFFVVAGGRRCFLGATSKVRPGVEPEGVGPEGSISPVEADERGDALGGEAGGDDDGDEAVEPPHRREFFDDGREQNTRREERTGQRTRAVLLERLRPDAAADVDLGDPEQQEDDEARRVERDQFDQVFVFVAVHDVLQSVREHDRTENQKHDRNPRVRSLLPRLEALLRVALVGREAPQHEHRAAEIDGVLQGVAQRRRAPGLKRRHRAHHHRHRRRHQRQHRQLVRLPRPGPLRHRQGLGGVCRPSCCCCCCC